MEWKSSTDKEKYGDMIGEVIHHTLFEDGTITKYDVKFGNKTIKNIPTEMLEVVELQEHSHEPTEDEEDEEENEMIKIKIIIKLKSLLNKKINIQLDLIEHFGGGENH